MQYSVLIKDIIEFQIHILLIKNFILSYSLSFLSGARKETATHLFHQTAGRPQAMGRARETETPEPAGQAAG